MTWTGRRMVASGRVRTLRLQTGQMVAPSIDVQLGRSRQPEAPQRWVASVASVPPLALTPVPGR
ncbi:MAG TPA: hypothetical protein VFI47_22920, partial [Acidimicrobiales bacterium]|nr:hypothetical protein [Acidimicrobiales bacterium]